MNRPLNGSEKLDNCDRAFEKERSGFQQFRTLFYRFAPELWLIMLPQMLVLTF